MQDVLSLHTFFLTFILPFNLLPYINKRKKICYYTVNNRHSNF